MPIQSNYDFLIAKDNHDADDNAISDGKEDTADADIVINVDEGCPERTMFKKTKVAEYKNNEKNCSRG